MCQFYAVLPHLLIVCRKILPLFNWFHYHFFDYFINEMIEWLIVCFIKHIYNIYTQYGSQSGYYVSEYVRQFKGWHRDGSYDPQYIGIVLREYEKQTYDSFCESVWGCRLSFMCPKCFDKKIRQHIDGADIGSNLQQLISDSLAHNDKMYMFIDALLEVL
jgi:hypothetical protein